MFYSNLPEEDLVYSFSYHDCMNCSGARNNSTRIVAKKRKRDRGWLPRPDAVTPFMITLSRSLAHIYASKQKASCIHRRKYSFVKQRRLMVVFINLLSFAVLVCNRSILVKAQSALDATALRRCYLAMAVGDINRDEKISQDAEYVRFVDQLSGRAYGQVSFDALPAAVQSNFNTNAVGGEINVSGSKPGSSPSASQEAFLQDFCLSTTNAIAGTTSTASVPAPTPRPVFVPVPRPAPVARSGTLPSDVPTVSIAICKRGMAISDTDRNDLLNQVEYVKFLGRLNAEQFGVTQGYTFDTLPVVLQTNFDNLSSGGAISCYGTKPGQNDVTAEQSEFLSDICDSTSLAMYEAFNTETSGSEPSTTGSTPDILTRPPSPTAAPATDSGSTQLVISFSDCQRALIISDSSRDDVLQEEEYAAFVNSLSKRQFQGLGYSDLPSAIQSNYLDLIIKSGGQIAIYGAKPSQRDATAAQIEFLETLCEATGTAINQALIELSEPETAPTLAPTTLNLTQPTLAPTTLITEPPVIGGVEEKPVIYNGVIDVYSAFIVSNNAGFFAEVLLSGANRRGLANAYNNYVVNIFSERPDLTAPRPESFSRSTSRRIQRIFQNEMYKEFIRRNLYDRKRQLRERKEQQLQRQRQGQQQQATYELSLVDRSADVIRLVDFDGCANTTKVGVDGVICQAVYASFQLDVLNATQAERDWIEYIYIQAVQNGIDEGLLMVELDAVKLALPTLIFDIERSEWPVRVETEAPTPSPIFFSGEFGGTDVEIRREDLNSAATAFIVLSVFGCIGAGLYYIIRRIRKSEKRKAKAGDDESVGSLKETGAIGGLDGSAPLGDFDIAGDDSAEFDAAQNQVEKNQKGGRMGVFGKKDNDNVSTDLDDEDDDEEPAVRPLGTPRAGENKNNLHNADFEVYAFDEPAELVQHQKELESQNQEHINKTSILNNQRKNEQVKNEDSDDEEDFFGKTPVGREWGKRFGEADPRGDLDGKDSRDKGKDGKGDIFGKEFLNKDKPYSLKEGEEGEEDDDDDEDDEDDDDDDDDDDDEDDEEEEEDNGTISGDDSTISRRLDQGDVDSDDEENQSNLDESQTSRVGSVGEGEGYDDAIENAPSVGGASRRKSNEDQDEEFDEIEEELLEDDESTEVSETASEKEQRAEYRKQVEELVRKVVPDEIDNVDVMMEQFYGREGELVNTLKEMEKRTSSKFARAAVHKSKHSSHNSGRDPNSAGGAGYAVGASEGSVAIAAASTLGPNGGYEPRRPPVRDEDTYGDEDGTFDGTYDEGTYDTGTFDESGTGTGTGTYETGTYDESGTYESGTYESGTYDDEGTYDESGTYDTGTYDTGTYDTGTYDTGTQGSESYVSESYRSHTQERSYASGSYIDEGDEGEYVEEDGSEYSEDFEDEDMDDAGRPDDTGFGDFGSGGFGDFGDAGDVDEFSAEDGWADEG